jgi:hypothetical protein
MCLWRERSSSYKLRQYTIRNFGLRSLFALGHRTIQFDTQNTHPKTWLLVNVSHRYRYGETNQSIALKRSRKLIAKNRWNLRALDIYSSWNFYARTREPASKIKQHHNNRNLSGQKAAKWNLSGIYNRPIGNGMWQIQVDCMNCVRNNMGWPGNGVCEDRMTKCRHWNLVIICPYPANVENMVTS